MNADQHKHTLNVCAEVMHERERQHAKWGEQNHPSISREFTDYVTRMTRFPIELEARRECNRMTNEGRVTYAHIALEEFAEVIFAVDEKHRKGELIQLAAVCVAWVEAIDRKEKQKP